MLYVCHIFSQHIADEVCPTPPQPSGLFDHSDHIMSRDVIVADAHDLVHLVFPEPGPIVKP
jgi:hypothetical protein